MKELNEMTRDELKERYEALEKEREAIKESCSLLKGFDRFRKYGKISCEHDGYLLKTEDFGDISLVIKGDIWKYGINFYYPRRKLSFAETVEHFVFKNTYEESIKELERLNNLAESFRKDYNEFIEENECLTSDFSIRVEEQLADIANEQLEILKKINNIR